MYQCVCPTGFTGIDCEVNIDDCVNVTCQNNGRCIDEVNDYYCQCPVTHKGEHCEKSELLRCVNLLASVIRQNYKPQKGGVTTKQSTPKFSEK